MMFRLLEYIESKLFEPLALILFSISGLVMFVEAMQRTLFNHSFEWSSEISTYSMVWAVLLVMARAGKKGHHIRMEMLVSMLPASFKKGTLTRISKVIASEKSKKGSKSLVE